MSMRTTTHNGRASKKGTYTARHNDRNFDTTRADNINQNATIENDVWHVYEYQTSSFDEAEHRYYKEHYQHMLDRINANYAAQGHKERQIKDIDKMRRMTRYAPEETILQIGTKDNTIPPEKLSQIVHDYLMWHQTEYPQCKILDYAGHFDEATPHYHVRQVWEAHDKDGDLCISQSKALEEMGVKPPNPDKKRTRYNNAKMTYTKQCRDMFNTIAKSYGIEDIELTPKTPGKKTLEKNEWLAQRLHDELLQLQDQRTELQHQMWQLESDIDSAEGMRNCAVQDQFFAEGKLADLEMQMMKLDGDILKKQEKIDQLNTDLSAYEEMPYVGDCAAKIRENVITMKKSQYEKLVDSICQNINNGKLQADIRNLAHGIRFGFTPAVEAMIKQIDKSTSRDHQR